MDRTSSATPPRPGTPGLGPQPGASRAAIDLDDDLLGSYSGVAASEPVAPPAVPPPLVRSAGNRRLFVAGAGLVVAILVIAVLAYRLGSASSTAAPSPAAGTTAVTTTATTLPAPDIYRLVAPSVVVITTAKGSLGSGVIVTATGRILTANHVVSDGSALGVTFADGTRSTATIASADAVTDVATLTPATLPEVVVPATLGGGLQVGADVVAIGNPLGFTDSTSRGIVSGLDRTADTNAGKFSGLIQFDAAVNPGSSGGPLLNNQGLVVGIVVSLANAAQDDSFAGIGFAVPIGTALGGGGGNGPGGGPQL